MIAVMIVSLVIAALLKLQGNTNHLFNRLQSDQRRSSYATLLLWNPTYGLNKSQGTLYRLVDNFDMDDELRRELKKSKFNIEYKKLQTLEIDNLILEVGKTHFSCENLDIYFNRVHLR